MSKEEFKMFVREHPSLLKHVNGGDMTWQKFYDMYRLYGSESSVWNDYFQSREAPSFSSVVKEDTTLKDFIAMIKTIDFEKVRKGIDGVQKAISLIQDLGTGSKESQYEPRPIYRHLDD